jgi:pimeloyl-ACP methyl ester carboxylesterase
MRAHRAFRQLNTLLNRAGANVLRFDYSCTGDSGGSGEEATVEEWMEDIDWAVDELMDNARSESISILGLRWGATLAALATQERDEVDHLVLWDPIVSGEEYLDSVLDEPRAPGLLGVEGFPYSEALRDGMLPIDLREHPEVFDGRRVTVLVAEDREDYRDLVEAAERHGTPVGYEHVPSPADWSRADPFGDALIPQEIIQTAVGILQGETS